MLKHYTVGHNIGEVIMRSFLFSFTLLVTFTSIPASLWSQTGEEVYPEGIFVDLTQHEGWGPFSPREGYEPRHWSGTFTLAGQNYKVYQLLDPDQPRREQRFIFRQEGSEVTFTENGGAPVYYRFEYIELERANFKIQGYSARADQFVLLLEEDVAYADQGLPTGTQAPRFRYRGIDGTQIDLSAYQGKYVLLDFWGTWCRPCLDETPYLKAAYSKFGDKIEFIGIAVDKSREKVQQYVEAEGIDWPQIFIPDDQKRKSKLVKDYNVLGYPSMFLIGPEGNVLIGNERGRTRLRGERLSETLEKMLSDKY